MKKGIKVILIILGIWLSVFLVDFICVKTIKRPIFMIRTVIYKDGGTKEYLGLGYKVIKCNTLINDNKVTIGTWALDYNCDTKANNNNENTTELDSVKFSKEYGTIDASNPFVYRNINEILNILENGTGIIYLGFPECPWCKAYIPYLNSVAKENNLEKIYYFNILEDRKNNTVEYKKIVSLTSEHLRYDEEGNKRIYVPAIIAVKEGKVVGFDDETSYDTKGFSKPEDYWNDKSIENLKQKLNTMIKEVNNFTCSDCNK